MTDFPETFLRFNEQQTKNLVIVVEIPGVDLLSNAAVFTKIRYGDAGLKYGQPMLDGQTPVYGGLRRVPGVRDILSLDQSPITISQRLESEAGRASVSQLSMSFVDKDQYMSQVIAPGQIIQDIMGAPVRVFMGYKECSFPEDYVVIFRGRVTQVQPVAGLVTLQFSDPNFARRQQLFSVSKTKLLGALTDSATTIPVLDNFGFYKHALSPDGVTYDCANPYNPDGTYNVLAPKRNGVKTYLRIDDEWIEYGPLDFGANQFTNVVRGARGTVPSAHDSGSDVECAVQIQDNGIDMALKLMLSTGGKNWIEDVPVLSVVKTFDGILGDQARAIILPRGIDAQRDYGLVAGDWITTRLSAIPGNNQLSRIIRFEDLDEQPNRIIYIDKDLVAEYPTTMVMDFRSQFDTYPELCGLALDPQEVDVQNHVDIRDGYLSEQENTFRFLMRARETGKSFIESELYLVMGAYSLTKRGRLSVGYTRPPIAGETLIFLNKGNVKDPDKINVARSLTTNRKFFNEVVFQYDADDDGKFRSTYQVYDADSHSIIGVLSTLPINSRGLRSDLGSLDLLEKRASFILSRYKMGATVIGLKTNWEAGCQVEAGDIVALQDEGNLQIANLATGERNLGAQLFEVMDRSLDHKNAQADLKLVGSVAADITDRYAVFSPSSFVVSGDESQIIIRDSFGSPSKYPGDEMKKWRDYIGQEIIIHDPDWNWICQTTIIGMDPTNNYRMFISGWDSPPPYFTDAIIDIPPYPADDSKTHNSLYKSIHAFRSATVPVTAAISASQFKVSLSDAAKFFPGARLWIHDPDWDNYAKDAKVLEVLGDVISLEEPLAFTPDATYTVEGIGFPDGGGTYRFI